MHRGPAAIAPRACTAPSGDAERLLRVRHTMRRHRFAVVWSREELAAMFPVEEERRARKQLPGRQSLAAALGAPAKAR